MAIEVGQGLKGNDVVSVLEELRLFHQAMPRKSKLITDRNCGAIMNTK